MQKYLKRISQAHRDHPWFFSAGIHDVEVAHDDDCLIYSREPVCDCDPRITIRTPNGQIYRLLGDGSVEQIILV